MSTQTFIFLVFSILIVSCTSKSYIISTDYENKKISGAVLILPDLEQCKAFDKSVTFSDTELSILQQNCVNQFNSTFGKLLQSGSTFSKVLSIKYKYYPERMRRTFALNEKDSISLELPSKPVKLDIEEDAYLLHIENFEFTVFEQSLDTSDPAKHYTVSSPSPGSVVLAPAKFKGQYFSITFNYAIYQNNSLALVCYGKMNLKDRLQKDMDFEKIFSGTLDKTAARILKNTPFEK